MIVITTLIATIFRPAFDAGYLIFQTISYTNPGKVG